MTAEHAELWARILAFDIDGEERALSFAARLARENGWPRDYAARVVVEYKRFVFLAITGTAPVTPSDQVDQAWHLHLTYSRSYWERFCGEALGRPLHHEPTKGGEAEATRFARQYNETLAHYRTAFDHDPPSDIWPPAAVRFGDDLHYVRVNTVRNVVTPTWHRHRRVAVTALYAIALFPLLLAWLSGGVRFDANGPTWTSGVLGAFFLGLTLFAFWIEWRLARAARKLYLRLDRPAEDVPPLTPYDLAYLTGGATRAAQVAVTRLVEAGTLEYDPKSLRLKRASELAPGAPGAEREMFDRVAADTPAGTYAAYVVRLAAEALAPQFAHLERCGLIPPEPNRSKASWVPRVALGLFFFWWMTFFVAGCMFLSEALADRNSPAGLLELLGLPLWAVIGGLAVKGIGRKPVLTDCGHAVVRAADATDPVSRVALWGPRATVHRAGGPRSRTGGVREQRREPHLRRRRRQQWRGRMCRLRRVWWVRRLRRVNAT